MSNPRTAYRETAAGGATAVRLVVLLYEQMIQDLRQASQAIEENNIEVRTNRINHTLDIVCLLQGTLNMEGGGEVALNLVRFYEALRANLCKAQFQVSKETLTRQITDLLALRQAWVEVDRAESAGSVPRPDPLAADAANDESDQRVLAGRTWETATLPASDASWRA
jgi:flagellar secretion chaperone FliS